jgi:DNA-binding response OmpR family regulator
MMQLPIRILFIEPSPSANDAINEALTALIFEVDSAYSVAQGFTKLRESVFQIAIIGLSIPESSGINLMRVCRELIPRPKTILLVRTVNERNSLQYLAMGFDAIIQTPIPNAFDFQREMIDMVEKETLGAAAGGMGGMY